MRKRTEVYTPKYTPKYITKVYRLINYLNEEEDI